MTDEGVALQQKLEIHRSEVTLVKLAPLLPSSGRIQPVLHPHVKCDSLRTYCSPASVYFFQGASRKNENMFSGRGMFTVILHSRINSPAMPNRMFAHILYIRCDCPEKGPSERE